VLVLVVVLVLDLVCSGVHLVAAWPRCAVSRTFRLLGVRWVQIFRFCGKLPLRSEGCRVELGDTADRMSALRRRSPAPPSSNSQKDFATVEKTDQGQHERHNHNRLSHLIPLAEALLDRSAN